MTLRIWPAYVIALCLVGSMACSQDNEHAQSERRQDLASAHEVPLSANRVGIPITGTASSSQLASGEDKPDEPKDYWAPINFDRSNFEEVRNFVRERYIESSINDARAYSQAAAFALASDEAKAFLLFPETFYKARKDHPDEEEEESHFGWGRIENFRYV